MNYLDFREKVTGWSTSRGIYELLSWESQLKLYYDECYERQMATSCTEAILESGDRIVCLINCAEMCDEVPDLSGLFWADSVMSELEIGIAARDFDRAIEGLMLEISEDYNLTDVFGQTWEKIKDRRGMIVGDKWVKWESLNSQQKRQAESRGV